MCLTNFIPDSLADSVTAIDFSRPLDTVFFDFDNTLMPWNSTGLDEEKAALLRDLNKRCRVVIATNGRSSRLRELSREYEVLTELRKPLTGKLRSFIEANGIEPERSVFVGDNLVTDIFTANRLGMATIRVNPIDSREFALTRLYRVIEAVIFILMRKRFALLRSQT